jgi:hypothetical protein
MAILVEMELALIELMMTNVRRWENLVRNLMIAVLQINYSALMVFVIIDAQLRLSNKIIC